MALPAPHAALLGGKRISLLTLPGGASLRAWHDVRRGMTIGAQLRGSGVGAPVGPSLTGSLAQTIGLYVAITSNGSLGSAGYAAYFDGGIMPFQTGVIPGSGIVVLTQLGITATFGSGSYTTAHAYTGVCSQLTNQAPGTSTLAGPASDSSKPTVKWAAKAGRPTLVSPGGSTYIADATSTAAGDCASGVDKDFTLVFMGKTDDAAPSAVRALVSLNNNSDADPAWFLGLRNGTNVWRSQKIDDAGSASSPIDLGALDVNYHVHRLVQHGTTLDHYIDGALNYSGSSQNVGTATFNNYCWFALLRGGSSTNACSGEIGEAALYSVALTAPEYVEDFMLSGWGF